MKTKRLVSILLTIMMLASMLQITGMAKNAYTVGTTDESLKTVREILFYEDFDDIAVDTEIASGYILGDENYYQMKSGSANTVKVDGNGTNNYLYARGKGTVADDGTESFTNVQKAIFYLDTFVNEENPEKSSDGKFNGTYVTEFKWMQLECEMGMDSLFQQQTSNTKQGARLSINNTYGVRYRKGSSETNLVANQNSISYVGTWHNAKIVTNIATKKYDLYVDGRLCATNVDYLHAADIATDACFSRPFYAWGIKNAICYDDIIMYREAVDRTEWGAEDFSGYSETRDFSTWQNPEFKNSIKIGDSANYSATAVDRYDTWFEGLELNPTTTNANGIIDSENDELKMTAGGKVILAGGYNTVTSPKNGAGVSFTVRAENPLESHGTIFRMCEGNAYNVGIFLTLSAGAFMVKTGQNNYQQILSGVQANRDYHFTFWCNRTTGKYSVYIDGKCVATGMDFVRLVNSTSGNLYSFNDMGRIFEINLYNSITGACYYDDIKFWYDKRENIAQEAMMALTADGGVTKSIAAGTESVEFPEIAAGYDGYTLNWTSSDESVIDPATGAVNIGFKAKYVTLTAEVTDANGEYTLKRNIEVRVPAKLELSASWDGTKAICNAKVTTDENYDNTKLLLAIYDANETFLGVKTGAVVSGNGVVEFTPETPLAEGSYIVKAFALDGNLAPRCVNATAFFAIGEEE